MFLQHDQFFELLHSLCQQRTEAIFALILYLIEVLCLRLHQCGNCAQTGVSRSIIHRSGILNMTNIIILNVFISIPRRIISHNRIIATIRIHIEANQIAVSIYISIRIQEPPPSRIIISALQVVQPRLGIVVISSVTEGVIRPNDVLFQRGSSRNNGNSAVTPSVVGIGADLITVCIVDRNNVALEVLLKVEGVEDVGGIALGSVLQPDGRSAFVIQVDNQVISPRLADDPGAVQSVDVVSPVHDLVGADTVGVVLEFQEGLSAVSAHLYELAAVPVLPLPAAQNALRVLNERKLMLAKKRFPETTVTDARCA